MNYLVLGNETRNKLEEQYELAMDQYGLLDVFDGYVRNMFLKNKHLCLSKKGFDTYVLGDGCALKVALHRRFEQCLYAENVEFYLGADRETYNHMLRYSIELPGEWCIAAQEQEVDRRKLENCVDLSEYIVGTRQEHREFDNYWKQLDRYNQYLMKERRQIERDSTKAVKKTEVDGVTFRFTVEGWSEHYKEGSEIAVNCGSDSYSILVGSILEVNKGQNQLLVDGSNQDFLNQYLKKQTGTIDTLKVIDRGANTNLKRQRAALQRLYEQKTANPNLKAILMGEHVEEETRRQADGSAMEDYLKRFGDNGRQEEAFVGALRAPDIFLIQGPPGTGKTTVITELVRYAASEGSHVLVSSATHVAVDNVLERIQYEKNVLPVRIGKEDAVGTTGKKYLIDHLAEEKLAQCRETLEKYEQYQDGMSALVDELREKCEKELRELDEKIEQNREKIAVDELSGQLEKRIMDFVVLRRECVEGRKACLQGQLEDEACRRELHETELELARCEAQASIAQTDHFQGLRQRDMEREERETRALRQKITRLEDSREKITERLAEIDYYGLLYKHNKRMRKLEREKSKISEHIVGNVDFVKFIYDAQPAVENIRKLKKAKQLKIEQMEAEQRQLAETMAHKQALLERSKDIRKAWKASLDSHDTVRQLQEIYIGRANVICATCSGVASDDHRVFAEKEYDYVIVDEAAKCDALEILIPLVRGKKIILVGDHKQLYPFVEDRKNDSGFTEEELKEIRENTVFRSLFEAKLDDRYKRMLNLQYRMESGISRFVSENFYNGELQDGIPSDDQETSVYWIDSSHTMEEVCTGGAKGYINKGEAEIVRNLLLRLDQECTQGTSVGVITAYKMQAKYLSEILPDQLDNILVEANTIDAFQGKEKDIVVYDLVRTKSVTAFMKDPNRVNVAVSRAKRKLYVVGDITLYKSQTAGKLKDLYDYISQNGEVWNARYSQDRWQERKVIN